MNPLDIELFYGIVTVLWHHGQINLRSLMKFSNDFNTGIGSSRHFQDMEKVFDFLVVFKMLVMLFNSREELVSACQAVTDRIYVDKLATGHTFKSDLIRILPFSFFALHEKNDSMNSGHQLQVTLPVPNEENSLLRADVQVEGRSYKKMVSGRLGGFDGHHWLVINAAISDASVI